MRGGGGGFMSMGKDNYYREEEEGSTGVMLEEEDLSIQLAIFLSCNYNLRSRAIGDLRNCVIQNPPALDDDVKMKGVDNSCTLKHMFSYDPSRRERGGPSSATCVICMDVISISDTLQSPNCIHRFCKDCIEVYLADKIQEDIIRVKCPESKCEIALGMEFCKGIIPKEVFDKWKVSLLEASVLGSPRRIRCPFEECSAVFLDDGKNYLTRACPKCYRIFCMRCKVSWHLGKTCATFRRTRYHHLLPPGYLMFLRKQHY